MFNFLPKDDKFFDQLDTMARLLVLSAEQLGAIVQTFPKIDAQLKQIEEARVVAYRPAELMYFTSFLPGMLIRWWQMNREFFPSPLRNLPITFKTEHDESAKAHPPSGSGAANPYCRFNAASKVNRGPGNDWLRGWDSRPRHGFVVISLIEDNAVINHKKQISRYGVVGLRCKLVNFGCVFNWAA